MTSEDTGEIITALRERADIYALLARLFREEVDQAFLEQLSDSNFVKLPEPHQDSTLTDDLSQAARLLKGYLQRQNEATLTELAVDYARLFLGPNPAGAYPYESIYTSPDRLIMQAARIQAVNIYREEDLARSGDYTEPEDHIGFELEYMARQGLRAIEALQAEMTSQGLEYLEKQRTFLEKHLLPWVPAFCVDVQKFAQTDFYKGAAFMTRGFLSLEAQLIDELISELEEITR